VQLTASAMNRAVMPMSTEFDRSSNSCSITWESWTWEVQDCKATSLTAGGLSKLKTKADYVWQ